MRSTLFIAPTVPLNADSTVDTRYYTLRTLRADLPVYGGQFLLHGEPGAPIPGNATNVIHDGVTPWAWGDILADHPVIAAWLMRAMWTESDGLHDGTMRDYNLRVAASAVLSTLGTNLPGHFWLGEVL